MARAALDLITYARQSARQRQYQPHGGRATVVPRGRRLDDKWSSYHCHDERTVRPPRGLPAIGGDIERVTTVCDDRSVGSRSGDIDALGSCNGVPGLRRDSRCWRRTSTASRANGNVGRRVTTTFNGADDRRCSRPGRRRHRRGHVGALRATTATSRYACNATGADPRRRQRHGAAQAQGCQTGLSRRCAVGSVQGIVIIEATIDASGKVSNAKVLRSIARLDDAALDAVKQWEFEPTRFNGVPVPIIMSVTVNFTLAPSQRSRDRTGQTATPGPTPSPSGATAVTGPGDRLRTSSDPRTSDLRTSHLRTLAPSHLRTARICYPLAMTTLVRRSMAVLFALLLLPATQASAQLLAAKDGPIVYGHHHLNVTIPRRPRKFFVDALGGVPAKLGTNRHDQVPERPGILAMRPPTGGSKGTTVDHLAFSVTNLRQVWTASRPPGFRSSPPPKRPPTFRSRATSASSKAGP